MHMIVAILGIIMLLVIKKHVSEGLKTYQWFFVLLLSMSFGLFIFCLCRSSLYRNSWFFLL